VEGVLRTHDGQPPNQFFGREGCTRRLSMALIILSAASALTFGHVSTAKAAFVAGGCHANAQISMFWNNYNPNGPGYSIKATADNDCKDLAPMSRMELWTHLLQFSNGTVYILWDGYVHPICGPCQSYETTQHDETSYWDAVPDVLYQSLTDIDMVAPPGQYFGPPPPNDQYSNCQNYNGDTEMKCLVTRSFSWTTYVNRQGPQSVGSGPTLPQGALGNLPIPLIVP
jgi:hypothetical protein